MAGVTPTPVKDSFVSKPKGNKMSMKLQELIEKLAEIDQAVIESPEVEFIVVKTSGELVSCDVEKTASSMVKVLKMFGNKD
jgi:hypothetical protein